MPHLIIDFKQKFWDNNYIIILIKSQATLQNGALRGVDILTKSNKSYKIQYALQKCINILKKEKRWIQKKKQIKKKKK